MEIWKRKFRWISHTLGKDDDRPLKWNPQGVKERGDQETAGGDPL